VVSVVMLLIPVAAVAATSMFEDIPDDSIFVNDINWMKTNGFTKGCSHARILAEPNHKRENPPPTDHLTGRY
jgi:hypothetical protein